MPTKKTPVAPRATSKPPLKDRIARSAPPDAAAKPAPAKPRVPKSPPTPAPHAKAVAASPTGAPISGKLAILVNLLRRPEGVSVYEMAEATGWQIHSVRGALAGGLKRERGFTIVSEKSEGQDRIYRIPAEPPPSPSPGQPRRSRR